MPDNPVQATTVGRITFGGTNMLPQVSIVTAEDAVKADRLRREAVRERVAEAIWHRMAAPHIMAWDEEPDKERYRCAADAAMDAQRHG